MNRPSGGNNNLLILLIVPAVVSLVVTLVILRVWDSGETTNPVVVMPTNSATSQRPPLTPAADDDPTPASVAEGEPETDDDSPSEATDIPADCANPTHSVQSGQTTGAIAQQYGVTIGDIAEANQLVDPNFNPDFISVGQELLIPVCGLPTPIPTATPTVTPMPTASTPIPTATNPPAGTVEVSIVRVLSAGDITEEAVVVENEGSPVNLSGWVLTNGSTEFEFPGFSLFTGGAVTVFTRVGDNDPRSLYWGLTEALWEEGNTVELYNADGELVDSFVILNE